jgi:catechol 2,3-dioxygenase-like lactoylglutathione lyase family enzyme
VLGHLGINVDDLPAAKRYYDALMPLVGFDLFFAAADEFSYRPAGGKRGTYLFFYPSAAPSDYSRHAAGLQHIAFSLRSRTAVRDVHRHVVELGGTVVSAPQEMPQYPPPYFATFWLDPFGVMLEAVCHRDVD